ncbi:hypothetical protein COXBURSA331_A0961 [Coxiella burnetii RSA 331]|nr:hypothetical protein COXBURSA331_A0961 [Coxiella burnetii RSA 331]AIT63136.1 hypothetical protein CBNA_0836 [Coxiella burnetii str. Namibia]EDR36322.1 hypothetical protein COXBURSA334_1006 [Coxiella burnetii Q321]
MQKRVLLTDVIVSVESQPLVISAIAAGGRSLIKQMQEPSYAFLSTCK